ncbi:MAG: LUD domain-containing protein [Bacteroidetes bacterium]|nr:LUD domain-containing protein [Bacteroidota bacterium]
MPRCTYRFYYGFFCPNIRKRHSGFTPVHVVVAFPDQLVDDLKDAFNFIKSKYKDQQPSATTFITGPSRTADIGNELVTGAQGPAEVYLFLVDKR